MHKDIMGLFRRLGLKEREGKIYLACLHNKDGLFIHEITKLTKFNRSTVDLTTKRLMQRGFVNKVKVGRRMRFMADAPEAILFRQKQLVDDLEQVVPMLAKLGGEKKDMEILYLEGAEGYRRSYEDILLNMKFAEGERKDLLSFSSGSDAMRLYPNMQKGFINKRIKNGSWFKAIAPQDSKKVPEWINDPKALRAVKYMSDKFNKFQVDINVCADSLILYSPTPPIGGVIIRNAKIAEAMRTLFTMVWDMMPEG